MPWRSSELGRCTTRVAGRTCSAAYELVANVPDVGRVVGASSPARCRPDPAQRGTTTSSSISTTMPRPMTPADLRSRLDLKGTLAGESPRTSTATVGMSDGLNDFGQRPRSAEAVENVARDALDLLVAPRQPVGPVGGARRDRPCHRRATSYAPSIACPASIFLTAASSRESNSREARNSISEGSSGRGGRAAVVRVKWAAGTMARISNDSGVPSEPVGWGSPSITV